jgi:CBS domain-containing protein
MARPRGTTPLVALNAVVIDVETTGLDPRSARAIELAAVRLADGRLEAEDAFRRLIDPGEPIPRSATDIHGIDDAAVRGAPRFAQVWPELAAALGDAILIGHTVGFDLAVLSQECARASLAWVPPPALDTRLLAEIAEPELADYSPESLAAWLGLEIKDRHSALGDARAAGEIFQALVPRLRRRGIRTLAEAMRACRSLTRVLEQHHRAGWSETSTPDETAEQGARIDSYPYRHRAAALMSPARFIGP